MSDLDAFEPWLHDLMSRVSPGRRLSLSRRVGQILRRINALRVAANIEPDGSAMEARKPKKERKGKRSRGRSRAASGKMFRRIELARNMRVRAAADHVELGFKPNVAKTAEVHHFGLEDAVDKRVPNSIRTRYPARRLLGFGPGDSDLLLVEVLTWLEGK